MNHVSRVLWTASLLATLTSAAGVWAQDVDEKQSEADFKSALEEYSKRHYEDARKYCDLAKKKTARDTPGIRILEALLDVQTGRPKTGADALNKEIKPAEDERDRLQKKYDAERAGKLTPIADAALKELEEDLKRADERVVQIRAGLKRAAEMMAKVYITVPPEEQEDGLRVLLDGKRIDHRFWDGNEAIDVDAGLHSIDALTGTRPDVRLRKMEEANAQKPLRLTVHLNPVTKYYPVAGFPALKKEMDEKVKWLGERSTESERTPNGKHKCYEQAWKDLGFISSQAEGLGEVETAAATPGGEDHPEVTKIRRLMRYAIFPCMEDCLAGKPMCDATKDVPMRVWPGRGSCGACAVGATASGDASQSDSSDLFNALVGLSLMVVRARRASRRRPT